MQNRQLHFVEPEEEVKCFNGPPRAMKQVRGKLRFGYTASRGVAPYHNGLSPGSARPRKGATALPEENSEENMDAEC